METRAALKRLEDDFAIAELSAPAGLFFVASLHFGARGDGFFVGNFRRVQRDLYAVASLEFVNDGFDVQTAAA
jgi:hypothetical protein